MAELGKAPKLKTSKATAAAKTSLTSAENAWNKRVGFNSQFSAPLNQSVNSYLTRPEFSYDFNADPVYQGLRDRYVNQGNMANYNTQAQVAANTGGFGNSYAQTAGYQAYAQNLQTLMDQIPQLAEKNLNRYNQEGQQMLDTIGLYQDLVNTDYQRFRDTSQDLYNDLIYFQNKYQYLNDQDLAYYKTNLDKWLSDRDYYYQKNKLTDSKKKK